MGKVPLLPGTCYIEMARNMAVAVHGTSAASIFNTAHPVLSDHGVQLTEDPLCGTAVRVAVRLRGSGPSVNDSFGTVKV